MPEADHSIAPARFVTIPELLARRESMVGRIALAAPSRVPLDYPALAEQVASVARELAIRGAADRPVAMMLPNGPELAVAFLAAASVGSAAPLNPAYQAEECEFYLRDLRAALLLIDETLVSPSRDVAARLGIPVVGVRIDSSAPAGVFGLSDPDALTEVGAAGEARGTGFLARGADAVALILHTSGTTSRPKQVPLSHRNLLASARNVATTLGLQPEDRCLNVMPLFHIHGLVAAVLSSLWAGAAVVCTPGFQAPVFFDWLGECDPTWYTAVPTMHQAIVARAADHAGVIARSRLRFIRSSSSALPRTTLVELERIFDVPVVEAYGMTEAAHQVASNPLPPAERKAGSVGPAAGPEVAILDEAGAIQVPGILGEVAIRGPDVTVGYANNPAANQAAFTGGWFRTGDQGYLDADGYLFLTGRLKELINRGGEKIAPGEVDDALLAHPAVQQALAFAVRHPQLGEDVAAAVVLKPDANASERQLREFLATRLAYFKVPRRIVFLETIPKGATGKLQRIGFAEKVGLASFDPVLVKVPHVSPRTPVEEVVAAIWAEVLRTDTPGVNDNFFTAGGDSITAAQLVSRVRDLLQVELPLLAFFDAPSVAGVAAEVETLLAAEPTAADGGGAGPL